MGHGWVTPNPDGSKARCGGPGLCPGCSLEYARESGVISREEAAELERRFSRVVLADPGRQAVADSFVGALRSSAAALMAYCRPSRERACALTALQEAWLWARESIAHDARE